MSEVSVSVDGHVATLIIDRPPHNHVSVGLIAALADQLEALDADRAVRAIVLASEGKNFCAGADLSAPQNVVTADRGGVADLYAQAVRLFAAKKPIVAAVQGAAVGAGLGLALVADHRIAADDARFSANFVKLGFHPGFGITHTLPRLIGEARASLMCLTGRRVGAEEAVLWGLADASAPLDQVRVRARALAREIAENAPLALLATRATLRAGLAEAVRRQTEHEAAAQGMLRATKDFAEGVRAVAERRPGRFTGE